MTPQSNAFSKGNYFNSFDFNQYSFPTPGIQSNILEGRVMDYSTNKPLSGAHVYYYKNGIKQGVITDMDGYYRLEALPTDVVTISFLGYDGIEDVASRINPIEFLSPKPEVLKTVYLTNEKETEKKPISKGLIIGIAGAVILAVIVAKGNNDENQEP